MPENMEDLPGPPDAKPVFRGKTTFEEVHTFLLCHFDLIVKAIKLISTISHIIQLKGLLF